MRLEYPSTRLGWKFDPPNVPWKVGSLQEKIDSEMRAMMLGVSPSDSNQWLFSVNSRDTNSPTAIYNPDLWCAGKIDLSPISVIRASSPTDDRFPVTLIHKHFVYAAAHIRGNGPYVFKRPDGGYETRTITSWFAFPTLTRESDGPLGPTTQLYTRDSAIGLLSAPIENITPALVLPDTLDDWFPPIVKPLGWPEGEVGYEVPMHYLPALCRKARKTDGTDRARITVVTINKSISNGPEQDFSYPIDPPPTYPWLPTPTYLYPSEDLYVGPLLPWSDTAIGGDSGSPWFWPFNGRMLLLGAHYTAGSGPGIAKAVQTFELKMNELATTYGIAGAGSLELHKLDLNGFATY